MSKDLYQILGVKETAKADEIKRAYRDFAKKFHPDKTGGDKAKESKFKDISAAYEVLSDPKRREQYDALRRSGFQPGDGRAAPPGFDPSVFAGIDGIEELLGRIFGGQRRPGGGGARAGTSGRRVVFEGGSPFGGGFETFDFGGPVTTQVADEQVRTRDGHIFTRRAHDLYFDLELSIDEAVLGGRVAIPTPEGSVTMTIPPGTSSGTKMRLRGRGDVRPDGARGDLYAVVKIVVPTKIDAKAAELLKEFSKRAPVKPRR
jgi:curved DNA-binding protein